MKHHHTFLMLILLGVAHQAEAQFDPKDQHIDLYLSAGASYWQPEWKDMAQFAGGYNQYFASTLTQPLGTPQAKFSPYLEGGLGLGNSIDIAIGYSLPTEYNMAAEFANKERREFRLVTQQSEVRFAMNIFHIKKVFFGLHFAALFVKGKLYSGYRYRNDFLSYGVEKRMNGIFSTNDTQLSGGAQIYWLLGTTGGPGCRCRSQASRETPGG